MDRDAERRERGAALPDSGDPWRSPKHPASGGYEFEKAAFRGGLVVSEWIASALDSGICRERWPDFYRGWWLASQIRPRPVLGVELTSAELPNETTQAGWDAYPGRKYVDPWEHLTPPEVKREAQEEQTRRLRGA